MENLDFEPRSIDLDVHDADSDWLWKSLISAQTNYWFPDELSVYQSDQYWACAKSVLDIGCGNGSYTLRLASNFSGKDFVGVDANLSFVEQARQKDRQNAVTFIHSDFRNIAGKFDFIVARCFLQHFEDKLKFFEFCRSRLNDIGCLYVIDANDSEQKFFPEQELFSQFFDSFRKFREAQRFPRDYHQRLVDLAESRGFDLVFLKDLIAPSTTEHAKQDFYVIYRTVLELSRTYYKMDYDYDALRQLLIRWYTDESCTAQLGHRVVALRAS